MKERFPTESQLWWPVFAFLLLLAAEPLIHANTNAVLRLGFSASVFVGVNENDAKAAMKTWTQTILKEHGIPIPTDPQVLNGSDAIAAAVRNHLIDAVTMTAEEYWTLGRARMATNAILGVSAGLVTEEYLLLVRADSGFGRIDDLRGRSLAFRQNVRDSLAPVWFETLLLKSGLGQTHQFCSRVTQPAKLAQVILPVFFRQTDACVVDRRGFQTMIELNPQVGQQLIILASSPRVVPVAFLFRADYSDPAKAQIIAEIEDVHATIAGQQAFTLFQCDSLVVRSASALDSALELLSAHARLSEAAIHVASAKAKVGEP